MLTWLRWSFLFIDIMIKKGCLRINKDEITVNGNSRALHYYCGV